MLREIITPTEPIFIMRLPNELVGKTVEVIAFEINPAAEEVGMTKEQRIKKIEEITKNSLVDLSNFTFNRNEANNYDQ
ncbi:MAG: hypothetical protein ACTHK0_01595 [Ginsengibacter sp.]